MSHPSPNRRQALLMACLAPQLRAQPEQPVLAVGTTFARIYEPDPGHGGARGLAVELLRRTFGAALRLAFLPYPRAQIDVEQGDADILVGPYRTPEREPRFLFSQRPFYEDAMVFYARRGGEALWSGDFPALAPLSVGAVKGWAYGAGFEAMRPYIKRLTFVTDVAKGLQMLRLERLDLFASNERNTVPVLDQLGMRDAVALLSPPLDQLRGHFAFTRSARGQELRARHDTGFEALLRSGEYARLAQQWGIRPTS